MVKAVSNEIHLPAYVALCHFIKYHVSLFVLL